MRSYVGRASPERAAPTRRQRYSRDARRARAHADVPALWHQCCPHALHVRRHAGHAAAAGSASPTARSRSRATRRRQLRAGAMHAACWLASGAGRLDEAWRLAGACRRRLPLARPAAHSSSPTTACRMRCCTRCAASARPAMRPPTRPRRRSRRSTAPLGSPPRACVGGAVRRMPRQLAAARRRSAAPARRRAAARPRTRCEWGAAPLDRASARACVALLDGDAATRRAGCSSRWPPTSSAARLSAATPGARHARRRAAATRRIVDAAAATLRPWLDEAHASGETGGALLAGPQRCLIAWPRARWGERLDAGDRAAARAALRRCCAAGAHTQRLRRPSAVAGTVAPAASPERSASASARCWRASPPATATS